MAVTRLLPSPFWALTTMRMRFSESRLTKSMLPRRARSDSAARPSASVTTTSGPFCMLAWGMVGMRPTTGRFIISPTSR